MPLRLSYEALHAFFNLYAYEYNYSDWLLTADERRKLDEATFDQLKALKEAGQLKVIVASQWMSENHLGGDDVVTIVDETLAAVKDGFEVFTWYGGDAEVLIMGVKPSVAAVLDLHEGEEGLDGNEPLADPHTAFPEEVDE